MAEIKKYLGEEGTSALISNVKTKLAELDSKITTGLETKADSSHSHDVASSSANGFMSAADKIKLDGIDPSLYAKSIGLTVDADGDAMITWDSQVLPVEGVEF